MGDIEVKGSDLRRLTRDLRKHADGKRLAKELRQELRAVAKPFVPIVKSAIAAIPSKGQNARLGRPSLRAQMQRATKMNVRTQGKDAGVVVRVEHTKMSGYKRVNLPAYMESEPRFRPWQSKNWDREYKVQPPHPFFYAAVRPAEMRAVRAIQDVVERIAKEIERG